MTVAWYVRFVSLDSIGCPSEANMELPLSGAKSRLT